MANGAALHDLRRRRTTIAPTISVVCSAVGPRVVADYYEHA
jgi:hypothetical protein